RERSSRIALPAVQEEGAVLSVERPVAPQGEKLRVILNLRGPARTAVVGVSCHGRIVAQEEVAVQPGRNQLELMLAPGSRGVLRVALYAAENGTLRPSAERLVYRYPAPRLLLAIEPEKRPRPR